MAQEIFFSVLELPEGGYEARAVGHAIFTKAATLERLNVQVEAAVRCHFDNDRLPQIHLVRAPRNRRFGTADGEFTVPDDFNDPLPKEIEDLFYGE